jgi:hypothetical protein
MLPPLAPHLLLLLPALARPRHLLSVIELGGRFYYDSSHLLYNKTFQVSSSQLDLTPLRGGVPGRRAGDVWALGGGGAGLGPAEPRGHGASGQPGGGGVAGGAMASQRVRGRQCGAALCLESAVEPGGQAVRL